MPGRSMKKRKNGFPRWSKAGTIAPFFIKAPVLCDAFADILATLRCSDATNCPVSAPSPLRPGWMSLSRYASVALARKAANSWERTRTHEDRTWPRPRPP